MAQIWYNFTDFSEAKSAVNLALCLMNNASISYFITVKWRRGGTFLYPMPSLR